MVATRNPYITVAAFYIMAFYPYMPGRRGNRDYFYPGRRLMYNNNFT
jgi:hypothetical protein